MKKLVSLFLCLCMLFALAACEAAPAAETPAAEAPAAAAPAASGLKELTIAVDSEPSTLDSVMDTSDDCALIATGAVFEKLVECSAEDDIILELAESFEVSEDATEWTYHLRQGIKFHNGKEMTSEDVVASLNRWLDNASTPNTFVGGARFEAVDPYTVTIKMPAGTGYLNNLMANFANAAIIVPKECVEEAQAASDGLLKQYIGTGPYKVEEWKSAAYVKLVANEDYQPYGNPGEFSGWGGYKGPYYDVVWCRFVTDPTTIDAGMKTGEYDMTSGLDMTYLDAYKADFNYGIDASELNAVIFNKKEGWGANPKFRQAVQALLNVDDIMFAQTGSEELYQLYSSYMFPGAWYTEAGAEYYNQANKERALELFAEAGFTANDTFIILVASDSADFMTYAQVIQQQFMEVGLKCELLTYEWGTFVQIRNNEPDKYNAFITSFSPKVIPSLNLFLSATWAGWCTDERIQNDLAAINAATELEEGKAIWDALQQYMYEEYVPVVKLGVSTNMFVYRKGIVGMDYKERMIWYGSHAE